ncbi:MAG: hypothetical protein LBO66_01145 [Deltaproteobacteria bacterium]|jgi:hypothetical protein|nr:hypothetical protein [Deltaproteobacteria bacterium]
MSSDSSAPPELAAVLEPLFETFSSDIAKGEAGVDWFYVLTRPITQNRDTLLVLEIGEESVAPVFVSREDALGLRGLMGDDRFVAQAMHKLDIAKFASQNSLTVKTVSGGGRILADWKTL